MTDFTYYKLSDKANKAIKINREIIETPSIRIRNYMFIIENKDDEESLDLIIKLLLDTEEGSNSVSLSSDLLTLLCN